MTCPHCGADVPSGSSFCYACRKRVTGASGAPPAATTASPEPPARPPGRLEAAALERPGIVLAIAILDFLGAAGSLLAGGLVLFAAASGAEGRALLAAMGLVALLMSAAQVACGVGLMRLRPWARTLQIVMACLSICNVLSILILIYLLRPGVKVLFSGRSPHELSDLELQLAARQATVSGGGVAVVVGLLVVSLLVLPAVIGIVAAIAIPSLLRARVSANEAGAIGDMRTFASVQAAYQGANGGHFEGQASCLARPQVCIPGYSGPPFLDDALAEQKVARRGYVFRLLPGPTANVDTTSHSPTSVATFAWVAEPAEPNRTGVRSFCTDQTGVIFQSSTSRGFRGADGTGCPPGASEPLF